MEDEKPRTSHLVLKPKVITPTDPPAIPGDGTAISVQLIHRQNQLAEDKADRRRKKGEAPPPVVMPEPALAPIFKPKEITPLDPPAKAGDEAIISIPEILQQNIIAEEKSGWGRIRRWTKKKSRKTRDFLVIVGGLDLVVAILMKTMPSPMTFVYGISAITLMTSMGGWVVFFVMDDY